MNTNKHKELALKALIQMRGDDYYRASTFFQRKTPEQMQEQHGQSGKTCAEILAEYKDHYDQTNAAIDWLKSL